MVLVASINPNDRLHSQARNHLNAVSSGTQTFVPAPVLIEFELEMKTHGFSEEERITVFEDLSPLIPNSKIIPQSVTSMIEALNLYTSGMSYFDSLVSSMAKEIGATIITKDRAIANVVETEW